MDSYPTDPYGNPAICHECGGLCCALYLAHDENGEYIGDGWLPEYIELWLGRFVESGALRILEPISAPEASTSDTQTMYVAGNAQVQPLHDPRLSYPPTPQGEAYRATLPAWVDVRKCQFCHPETGCMLPPEYRTPICHEYRCELWETAR